MTSDTSKVLYQITHSHYTYLYLDMNNPYRIDTYISVYCKELQQWYKCDIKLIVGIMLLDKLFQKG